MKNKLLFLLIAIDVLVVLTALAVSFAYMSRRIDNVVQNQTDQLIEIYQNHGKKQLFVSNRDNINLIAIRLRNPGLRNIDSFVMSLQNENGFVLRSLPISGRNISDDDWIQFQIAPLTSVSKQVLNINLSSTTGDQSHAILAYTDNEGNLAMRVYSKERIAAVFRNSITDFVARFFADKAFSIFYLSLIGLAMVCCFYLKIRHVKASPN